ncbi:hypothetical protein PsYK624_125200 [Phanerochaete sordida]|uniref:Uncharacterized protein n=1 Tax=Phanerochaete sordida TaxID=48140 RepID=A0A9P3LIA1_9APHY|nr:hypothetical protein PsYK624_125200 [Phanerochaete sordida]
MCRRGMATLLEAALVTNDTSYNWQRKINVTKLHGSRCSLGLRLSSHHAMRVRGRDYFLARWSNPPLQSGDVVEKGSIRHALRAIHGRGRNALYALMKVLSLEAPACLVAAAICGLLPYGTRSTFGESCIHCPVVEAHRAAVILPGLRIIQ